MVLEEQHFPGVPLSWLPSTSHKKKEDYLTTEGLSIQCFWKLLTINFCFVSHFLIRILFCSLQ